MEIKESGHTEIMGESVWKGMLDMKLKLGFSIGNE
jgi:hypothetical protein